MYIYLDLRKETGCFTVGFYSPDGKWNPESDHNSAHEAAKRVHYLNGGDEEGESIAERHMSDHWEED